MRVRDRLKAHLKGSLFIELHGEDADRMRAIMELTGESASQIITSLAKRIIKDSK